jgi:hypothetical protein
VISTATFYDWQPPNDMLLRNKLHGIELGKRALERIGRDFRESFVAAHFAKHREADAVRLLRPHNTATPDFAIRLGDSEHWYEITEADRPGRRRGQENLPTVPQLVEDHEWTTSDAYFEIVLARAEKKACKTYARCDGLIIYDNAWPITDREAMTRAWWLKATAPARAVFPEVWRASDRFERLT